MNINFSILQCYLRQLFGLEQWYISQKVIYLIPLLKRSSDAEQR